MDQYFVVALVGFLIIEDGLQEVRADPGQRHTGISWSRSREFFRERGVSNLSKELMEACINKHSLDTTAARHLSQA